MTLHPGVSLLRPSAGRPYFTLKWTDARGQSRSQSTGLKSEPDALQMAIEKSQELAVTDYDLDLTWEAFTARYEAEALGDAPKKTRQHWTTARGWYARLMNPKRLVEVNSSTLSRFVPKLRAALMAKNKRAPASTIGSYLKQLKAAFGWAYGLNLMLEPVKVKLPRRVRKGGKFAKSRPVILEEFEVILLKAETVRPDDYAQWQRLLWGYWHSGFRLRELLKLSWDSTAAVAIDTRHKYPLVRFSAAGHKRGEDQYQVITPEFWALIKDLPRTGKALHPVNQETGKPYDADWIGTIIRRCGAGVKTGILTDKTASSHDLGKRAWTTRWSGELSESDLANLARHKSPSTTQDYYVLPALEELAAKVGWGKEEP